MRVTHCDIPDVLLIEPDVHTDSRGFFVETYRADIYRAHGVPVTFVQDNHSRSGHRTIRGLHLQVTRPQAKLMRVVEGEIFDVAVDVRRGSPTFGQWVSTKLSADNFRQCYVPEGFAHGFAVTSASAQVEYKCSDFYDAGDEIGIAWNDPALAIRWPFDAPILSARDTQNPALADVLHRLPEYARTKL